MPFAGEFPFDGGVISISSQTDGVKDSANWFWDDAQPDSNGATVRESVDSLATLFREVRYSEKPSECDLVLSRLQLIVYRKKQEKPSK